MTYAYQAGTCQSTGWTCMARPNAPGTYGPFNWTAGVTYYILVDDEKLSHRLMSFILNALKHREPITILQQDCREPI
jgi:hypothetical protein